MRGCRAWGTLIVPEWTRAAWWPLVVDVEGGGERWAADVVDAVCLGHAVGWDAGSAGVLVPPAGGTLHHLPKAKLWALRFDCPR